MYVVTLDTIHIISCRISHIKCRILHNLLFLNYSVQYLGVFNMDIDAFVGDAQQVDDITMLGLHYLGTSIGVITDE